MKDYPGTSLRYSILDPTGNITALVESPVAAEWQPTIAARLMTLRPEVEQVGFVRARGSGDAEGSVQGVLRMAGGEFCGNASLSAAALYLLRRVQSAASRDRSAPETVRLRVSGAAEPVEVRLLRTEDDAFRGGVRMPPARGVEEKEFVLGSIRGSLPLIRMEGISHAVIEPDSPFRALKENRTLAEQAVKDWCRACGADGLGLMFLESVPSGFRLIPLVYVPGSGTVFWENSCASGSSAVGMYLAARNGGPVKLSLEEPGGVLRVESDPARGETWLYGGVRLTEEGTFSPSAVR